MTALDWAIWNARHLGKVFPLYSIVDGRCTCWHPDSCEHPGKHPRTRNGVYNATSDEQQILRWWTQWPTANIGVATGDRGDVLDLDGDTGIATFDTWWAHNVPDYSPNISQQLIVGTDRGQHWWGKPTGAGNRSKFLPDCDWRGKDGYAVGPGSWHRSGRQYTLLNDNPGCRLIEWPDKLVELIAPKDTRTRPVAHPQPRPPQPGDGSRYGLTALRRACERISSEPVGNRNTTLNNEALSIYRLVAGGELNQRIADECLLAAGLDCGLAQAETITTLKSARKAGLTQPRRAS